MECTDPETGEIVQLESAAQVIQMLEKGQFHHDMTLALAKLTRDVVRTGNKGKMQVTIELKPNGDMVIGSGTMKMTWPGEPRHATALYADTMGNLCRRDPNQEEMPFKTVDLDDARKK